LAGFADKSTSVAPTQTQTRDTPLVPFNEAGTAGTSASGAKTRSRPSNEYVLYSYGEPVAVSADGNTSYFGTDILGSVRNVTDKYGNVQSNYNYDAFGNPYLSNLDNDMSFGYCGKTYDNGTGLYNYGFRDYSPNQARFTTVDPIRDGNNWFSYVVNDPVNYIDPFGLEKTDPYFTNNTNDYYVVVDEHPELIEESDINNIIIPPGENYPKPFDMVENIRTGEVRKVGNGGTLKATVAQDGTINYKATKDSTGAIGSSLLNAKSKIGRTLNKKIEGEYIPRSKPGLYTLDNRPDDINKTFTDPNHSTLRQAEIKALNLTMISNVATGLANTLMGIGSLPALTVGTSSVSVSVINGNVVISNINFNGSGSIYIGFNGFSMGCSK
ncbi:MAG: RHS repeat-associated core domain-containing protein, partial [Candidatus Gastranaerophilales bacterium]|nr:RHS repeat-associated core domain-containing protein [Candidatus Gastranaerophilales bacterium]